MVNETTVRVRELSGNVKEVPGPGSTPPKGENRDVLEVGAAEHTLLISWKGIW